MNSGLEFVSGRALLEKKARIKEISLDLGLAHASSDYTTALSCIEEIEYLSKDLNLWPEARELLDGTRSDIERRQKIQDEEKDPKQDKFYQLEQRAW